MILKGTSCGIVRQERRPISETISIFPRSQRRIWITNLQPCMEYSFRIVSFTEAGDLVHSEAKCLAKSVEIIHKNSNSLAANLQNENSDDGGRLGAERERKTITHVHIFVGVCFRDGLLNIWPRQVLV
ncbi:VIN3-like protein 1 [Abeliophyllum distichum]|uniref:VIN3-like protein 1 n=1 Tax=Abeliophyllum distichum TaxID=126358 RepID=A0ABD1SXP8_9LAMI